MKARLVLFALFFIAAANAQSWQWGQRGGSSFSISPDIEDVRSIKTDSQGNVYFLAPTGSDDLDIDSHTKTTYGYRDFVIGSFGCDGTFRWSTVIGGVGEDNVCNIEIDDNGDVYIALSQITYGEAFEPRFHFDPTHFIDETFENRKQMFIAKYNGQTGAYLWHKALQADGLTQAEYYSSRIYDFCMGSDGALYLLCNLSPGIYAEGQFNNTMIENNRFILKYASDGLFVNAVPVNMQVTTSTNNRKHLTFKKSAFNNNFYIAGYRNPGEPVSFGNQNVTGDMYVTSFDSAGQFLWMKTSDMAGGYFGIMDFHIDNSGDLYITGGSTVGNSFLGYNIVASTFATIPTLFKLDASGNLVWGSNASNAGGATYSHGVTVVGNEVIIATGINGITWGTLSTTYIQNAGYNPYLIKFNKTSGVMTGYANLSSSVGNSEYGRLITSDHNGSLYVGGNMDGNLTVNGSTLVSKGGGTDFFVAKYGSSNCSLGFDDYEHNGLKAYPNPAVDELFINADGLTSFVIYDILGQKVSAGSIQNDLQPINVRDLSNGVYVIELTDLVGKKQTVKFIKQ
jgi:hypothetical protein